MSKIVSYIHLMRTIYYLNSRTADFSVIPKLQATRNVFKTRFNAVKSKAASAIPGASKVATKIDDVIPDAPPPAPAAKPKGWWGRNSERIFGGDTQEGIPRAGLLDKTLAAGSIAALPLGFAPMFLKSADTKAVENMRRQDEMRESIGLKPLAATPQMIAENAQKAAKSAINTISDSASGIRVTNPAGAMQPPPPLPPGSLRGY